MKLIREILAMPFGVVALVALYIGIALAFVAMWIEGEL